MNRSFKACQSCGEPFHGGSDRFYCDKCAKNLKTDIYRLTKCADCGVDVELPPKSFRCRDCQKKVNKDNNKLFRQRGAKRPLGSTDICVICQKEYTVISGKQKYCSKACQNKGVKSVVKEVKKEYNQRTEVKVKKQERRKEQIHICIYCLQKFKTNKPINTCSDFCKAEQKKLIQAYADVSRGQKRNVKKYEDAREQYREQVKSCQ